MIIYMSDDILCVTNRMLCGEDFLIRIEKIAKENPLGMILREKNLSEKEYFGLAKKVIEICQKYDTPCILHNFVEAAVELNHEAIHLPLSILRTLSEKDKGKFSVLGTSCHSVEDAREAEKLGCTYIVAGHIFETDCKKGLEGRGINFLQSVCESISLPVYAIGGVNPQNISEIRRAGAKGACTMSGIMTCDSPKQYLAGFKGAKI